MTGCGALQGENISAVIFTLLYVTMQCLSAKEMQRRDPGALDSSADCMNAQMVEAKCSTCGKSSLKMNSLPAEIHVHRQTVQSLILYSHG